MLCELPDLSDCKYLPFQSLVFRCTTPAADLPPTNSVDEVVVSLKGQTVQPR